MKGFAKTYKCVNCNKIINPMYHHICPYCNSEQPIENRAYALGDSIVDIICPVCGYDKSFFRTDPYIDSAWCAKCGKTTYSSKEGKEELPKYKPAPVVVCPYCKSTNTKKISGVSKAGKVALFGVFALGKVNKQWHCNNCKSDF